MAGNARACAMRSNLYQRTNTLKHEESQKCTALRLEAIDHFQNLVVVQGLVLGNALTPGALDAVIVLMTEETDDNMFGYLMNRIEKEANVNERLCVRSKSSNAKRFAQKVNFVRSKSARQITRSVKT
jgi:hypothetical protein